MLLKSTITIPGNATLDDIDLTVDYLTNCGRATIAIPDRTISYEVDTADLSERATPPLAEAICRALMGDAAEHAIVAVRVAQAACNHAADLRKHLGSWTHTDLAVADEEPVT